MFYFAELAALAVCWLFYLEFYWMIQRKVRKACSREFIRKHLRTLPDRLFFKPVSTRANLGFLYYVNAVMFGVLTGMTVFHLLFGWLSPLRLLLRALTTVVLLITGGVGAACSAGSTEYLCVNRNITDRRFVLLIQVVSFLSELVLIFAYLYFAWCYIG